MAESVTHVTIQRGRKILKLEKCKDCCSSFHCPFCKSSVFKPAKLAKLKSHLKCHYKKAITHGDFTIHRCGLGCRTTLHYHCVFCTTTVLRKEDFQNHLEVCKHKLHLPSATEKAVTSPKTKETSVTSTAIVTAPDVQQTPSTYSSNDTSVNINTDTESSNKVFSNKVRVRPVVKTECPICNALMNKCNLQKHIDRKHTNDPIKDLNATFHLTSQCIDNTNGIFAVLKIANGRCVPLHVQYKTWGENHRVICESNECQVNLELAQSSGLPPRQCKHITSVTYCRSSAEQVSLTEETLTEMARAKWLSEETEKMCLAHQRLAENNCVPLSVHVTIGALQTKKCVSVFESHHILGRVMVVYKTKLNKWYCPCAKKRQSCIHRYIAHWHLFQTHPELFRPPVINTEEALSEDRHDYPEEMDDYTVYPPKEHELKNMVDYIFQNKKIPANLPYDICVPSTERSHPRSLWPNEIICQRCPDAVPLSDPILITQTAKILTNWCIIEDVATYYKQCPECEMCYRYQEWKDGLHNFNDDIILDIPLCITLRNLLQVHTSVSRAVEFLQLMTGVEYPPADAVLRAYLHFEALTEHEYKFSCVSCGDHPPVVIMGLQKKPLQVSENDIEEPPEDFKGEVNVEIFWEALSKEMIAQGFVANDGYNPLSVPPSFHFWAPWIGRNTRRSDTVLNTEFEKVHVSNSASENLISEDRLRDELFKQKVDVVRSLCTDCGLDSTGSYSELLLRLSDDMKSGETYKKVYEKIWAPSGGWGVIMCPCGIVYSLRNNLRAETPQDFADLLLSWKHMPNIIIYEFAHSLATHTNRRAPEQIPIAPFEGCLAEPTQDNVDLAKSGQLNVSLPWLQSKKAVADVYEHPVTGSSDRYVLYDKIHEGNHKDIRDVLRNVTSVPQLAGKVNSRIVKQLFTEMKKNSYFLRTSSPSTQLFQMRNIIHRYNEHKNSKVIDRSVFGQSK
nr:uncharacterized protein LOC129422787 [Misgurnus anguillicaudatus]